MTLLKKLGSTSVRSVSMWAALLVTCAGGLPTATMATTQSVVKPVAATASQATTASEIDTPKGILASGQIHKRTTPAISLANSPELPFFFKSWVFALLTVLIVVAIKRPWNSSKVKPSKRVVNHATGLIAPLVRS